MTQIRADFSVIQQLSADQGTHAGNVDGIRAALRTHASQALNTLDGGMGTEEHEACMKQVDKLIDEYLSSTRDIQRSTNQVEETFRSGGNRARTILGSGA